MRGRPSAFTDLPFCDDNFYPAVPAAPLRRRVLCDWSLHAIPFGGDPSSLEALLDEDSGYLYDTRGEWIACLVRKEGEGKQGKEIYTRDGMYVGFLSDDGRVLRERSRNQRPLRPVPAAIPKITPPSSVPLPPLFAELPWNLVDVFEEEPEVFKYVSELRPDWED